MKSTYQIHLPVVAIFISCLAYLAPAHAKDAGSSGVQADSQQQGGGIADEEGKALLQQLMAADSKESRLALTSKLLELRPAPVSTLKEHLARTRRSTDEERRKVLSAAGASVPDENGRFKTPGRETKKTEKSNDNFDWLTSVVALPAQKGLGDVISDVATIRVLAASKDHKAGQVIVDFAFSETGVIYRDECGRYLRKMSPYSLPALVRGSQNRRSKSMKRYTTYQLERLDRQNAHKAFDSAPTEELQIAIVTAFADSQYRESIFAVLANVDHVAPRVRAATRAAWNEFVGGKTPPKPPERKLELPNNKLTDKVEPLWLDHRELADVAIREVLLALTGSKQPKRATLSQLTEKLYAHYDKKRSDALTTDFDAALAMTASNPEQAAKIFDRILAQVPDFESRDQMVAAYVAHAEALEQESRWQEAGVAYGKASAVAPASKQAKEALRKHHLARVKVAEAQGKDATTELAIADEIEASQNATIQSKLLLFAGLAAFAGAFVLLLLGITLRRRPTHAR